MGIADAIRGADSEHVVYFLLCAYINTATHGDELTTLPERIVALPLAGRDDAKSRFTLLMYELDAASKRLDDGACLTIKEALTVFSAAVQRLQSLDSQRRPSTRTGAAIPGGKTPQNAPSYLYSAAAAPAAKASSQA